MANRPDNASSNQTLTKWIIIGAVALFAILLLMVWGGGSPSDNPDYGDKFRIINDEQAAKTRWVGEASEQMRGANEAVSAVRNQNTQILQRMNQLESELKQAQAELKAAKEHNSTITVVQRGGAAYPPIPNQQQQTTGTGSSTSSSASNPFSQPAQQQQTSNNQQQSSTWADRFISRNMGTQTDPNGVPLVKRETITRYQVINGALKSEKTGEKIDEKKNNEAAITLPPIPAGTIIPVVSITGVDAPTMSAAKSQPLPMLWRVTDLSIIPNAHNLDITGCHILSEAAGDLPSERVLIRTNTLTCTNSEGKLLEAPLSGYAASGKDSKNGIRGRVVSKQGTLLANALIAGFLDGVAESFSVKDQVTMTSAIGTTTTSTANDNELLEAGAYRGVSNAMSRLADFYLDMADQVFPIIELAGGTEADIIVTATQEMAQYKPKEDK
ncbi:MAG: TraB/VirB10 family protein [Helicobacteraceae bacterium]|jgi:conjugal transfer pilus assembly protein TraB|nr:TraB/VirB10 family protein [Helicobacteraceae bacterium]